MLYLHSRIYGGAGGWVQSGCIESVEVKTKLMKLLNYSDMIFYKENLSQDNETVYEFYSYGFDYGKKEMVRVDNFQVNSLTGVIDAYLDV